MISNNKQLFPDYTEVHQDFRKTLFVETERPDNISKLTPRVFVALLILWPCCWDAGRLNRAPFDLYKIATKA